LYDYWFVHALSAENIMKNQILALVLLCGYVITLKPTLRCTATGFVSGNWVVAVADWIAAMNAAPSEGFYSVFAPTIPSYPSRPAHLYPEQLP
jgi:hypothetical protein